MLVEDAFDIIVKGVGCVYFKKLFIALHIGSKHFG
jgi:hypothetical protein